MSYPVAPILVPFAKRLVPRRGSANESTITTTLVIFDSQVADLPLLYNALLPGSSGHTIQPHQDSIDTITNLLTETGATKLAIVAHGQPGSIQIGNGQIDRAMLETRSGLLQEWGVDSIALYSCEVGTDAAFVRRFAELTGAKIAASTSKLGAGNWELDGGMELLSIGQLANYRHTLAVFIGSSLGDIANVSTSAFGGFTTGTLAELIDADGDIFDGLDGTDVVLTGEGDDIIVGGNGNDYLVGNGGKDFIYGEADNDSLIGGAGNDTIFGGTGIDDIYGEAGDDLVFGEDGNDIIYGGDGLDILYGQAGDDTFYGDAGNDIILGGIGIDTINGDSDDDVLYGEDGNDIINGGDGLDIILGQSGDDRLNGDAGNDTILGGTGIDTINGGIGDDVVYGEDGNDIISGGDGLDILYGQAGDDILNGNAGNDIILGGIGIDTIDGGIGNDTLYGEDGNDIISGNDGDDILYGQAGDDTLSGNSGNDYLVGGIGNDTLYGDDGIDYLEGGDGIDNLYGGDGIDYLYSNGGNDRLYGQKGSDFLVGGAGIDTFIYQLITDAGDTIADFSTGSISDGSSFGEPIFVGGDIIDLAALFTNVPSGGISTDYLQFTQSGADTIISVDQDGLGVTSSFVTMATLNNFNANDLIIGENVLVNSNIFL